MRGARRPFAAKHHHHSHKKEAPHLPSLTREAAVVERGASRHRFRVKKHRALSKDATDSLEEPRKLLGDATTSPSSKMATEAATRRGRAFVHMRRRSSPASGTMLRSPSARATPC